MKQSQIKKGTRVESEHKDVMLWVRKYVKRHGKLPTNRNIYRRIATTHLKEDPNYYKKLEKMEDRK